MAEPTPEQYFEAMLEAGKAAMQSGLSGDQVLFYLRANYRDHVSEELCAKAARVLRIGDFYDDLPPWEKSQ